jgi:protein MAK11
MLGKQASMTRLQAEGLKVAWNSSGTGYSIMFDQEVGIYDMAVSNRQGFRTCGRRVV